MATKGHSKPERIARWKVMTVGLKPQLQELPLLAPLHTELEGIILQSEELDARHEALKAEIQDLNRTRDELAERGDELRKRMAATLQTVHGFQSEKLIEFGIPPKRVRGRDKRTRKRRSQTALVQTVPAPAPAASSSGTAPEEPAQKA